LSFLTFGQNGFLGAFEKLRRATISFVMSVCPSFRMDQLGCHGRIFIKFDISVFLEN